MQKLIAIFFLCALSFQILPVKELGLFMAKGTFSEEVPITVSEDHVPKNVCEEQNDHFLSDQFSSPSAEVQMHIQHKEEIPFSFIGDIFSPPPNA